MTFSIKQFYCIKCLCCLFCISTLFPVMDAKAHPHSWIDMKTEIVGDKSQVLGFNMSWTFDAMTSAYMLDGEDLSEKNIADTLALIASDIMRNLNEADYFTFFYDHDVEIENGVAENGAFVYNKGKLELNFYLPLSKPQKINHRTKLVKRI